MVDFSKKWIFRMTHIENIPHILGFGITHASSPNSNPDYKPIGDSTLISVRSSKMVPIKRKCLGDYTPFYFGHRTPMLYVLQKGYNLVNKVIPDDVVYLVSTVEKILALKIDFIFTNGHAVNGLTDFYPSSEIGNLNNIVDFHAAYVRDWNDTSDTDLKRRKEAELLVDGDIPVSVIVNYIVYNEAAKLNLLAKGIQEERVLIKGNYYF